MVTSKEGASDRSAVDELQQKQDPGNGLHESKSNSERSSFLMLPKKPCSELQQSQSPQNVDTAKHASQSHQGMSDTMVQDEVLHSGKMIHKRESTDLQRQNQDTGTGDCTSKADSEDPISILPKKESVDMQKRESTNSGVYVPHSNQEGSSLYVKTEIESDNLLQKQEETMLSAIPDVSEVLQERQGSINGVSAVQLEQVSVRSEKVLEKLPLRRKLESGINVLNSGQDGSITPRLPEKVSEDGYNWRKYGQKLVKGNEYIRSYYRCTHPNCLAKKQVERSHDGPIIDINYLGKHEHAKREHSPQVLNDAVLFVQSRRQDETALPGAQDKPSNDCRMTLHQIEPAETLMSPNAAARNDVVGVAVSEPKRMGDEVDDDQNSKRQKRDILNVDVTPENKANSELHFVVQTMSEVDFINDGYRWRKYGQKLVKGNPNPRSYYRCSNTGCPAKKHVERASHDLKLVITTYKRQHDHEMPATRTMTHSTSDSNMNTTVENGEPRPKPEENGAASLDVVIHNGAN